MTLAKQGQIVEAIASELAEIGRIENSDVLLYAEAGEGWMGGSIYFSRPDVVVWHSPRETEVPLLVRKLWAVTPKDKKWRGMIMFVSGNEFRTEFDYGEGWREEETSSDRREPVVRAYFGDKPTYYPPLEGAEEWPGK